MVNMIGGATTHLIIGSDAHVLGVAGDIQRQEKPWRVASDIDPIQNAANHLTSVVHTPPASTRKIS